MDRGKFYQLAESYRRIDRITGPNSREPQDVFVNIPVLEGEVKGDSYSTMAIRRMEAKTGNEVDQRIRNVVEIAERTFLEQKRKETEHAAEVARKAERDAILIPHRIQKIKEENISNQRKSATGFKTDLKSTSAPPAPGSNVISFNSSMQRMPPIYSLHNPVENPGTTEPQNNIEKYLYTKEGVPLTRDFVFPTKKADPIEEENSRRLKNYINDKKIKERHYIPSTPAPNHENVEKHKKERLAQDCAKLVAAAKLKLKKGQLESAFIELSNAINNGGIKHADVYYMFGEVNRLKGDYDKSVKYLTEALRFQLHSPYTYYSLGKAYASLGEYEKAVKVLRHFLELIETPDAHFELAKALSQLGENVDSIVHLTRAIELDPYCALYYAYRGEIYETQGFLELANKDYKRTLEVDHKFLDKYYKECEELESCGNYVMAAKVKEFINKIINAM